jgi:hypothetical protein
MTMPATPLVGVASHRAIPPAPLSADGGGSGGAAQPNLPPILGGNFTLDQTSSGVYQIDSSVPIGTTIQFTVSTPYGSNPQGQITKSTWGGGTSYSSYY